MAGILAELAVGVMADLRPLERSLGLIKDSLTGLKDLLVSTAASMIEINGRFQQMSTAIGVMVDSQERGLRIVRQIREMAAETPFSTESLTKGVQALVGAGEDAAKAMDMMRSIGAASAASTRGMEYGINHITLAITQMRAATKLSQQDLNQLKEAGIPAAALLAKHFGMSIDDLKGQVKNGAISMKEVVDGLLAEFDEKYGGGLLAEYDEKYGGILEKSAANWGGMLERLQERWVIFKQKVGEQIFDLASSGLEQLLVFLESDSFEDWTDRAIAGMQVLGDAATVVYEILVAHVRAFKELYDIASATLDMTPAGRALKIVGSPVTGAFNERLAALKRGRELDEQRDEMLNAKDRQRMEGREAGKERIKSAREAISGFFSDNYGGMFHRKGETKKTSSGAGQIGHALGVDFNDAAGVLPSLALALKSFVDPIVRGKKIKDEIALGIAENERLKILDIGGGDTNLAKNWKKAKQTEGEGGSFVGLVEMAKRLQGAIGRADPVVSELKVNNMLTKNLLTQGRQQLEAMDAMRGLGALA